MDIGKLQEFCLSLPSVTHDIKWEKDLCFSIGGKMFCVASLEPNFNAAFKVPDDEFEELSQQPGFIPAPYMARAKWVLVTDPKQLRQKEWEHYIKQSYKLVASKLSAKFRKQAGIDI